MTGKYKPGRYWRGVDKTLTEINRLQADRHYCDARGVFFAEGVRNLIQISDKDFKIEAVIYSERLLIAPLARILVRRLRRAGVPTVKVSPEDFRQVSRNKRASGVGVVAEQKWTRLHTTAPTKGQSWLVLGRVRSEGNFGTLIRSSEAFGGSGFILLDQRTDPYSPATLRASMGATYQQQFIRTKLESLGHWVRRHKCKVIGASPDGEADLYRYPLASATLILLGEERKGLTQKEREICHSLVRIPMEGKADSLNLGVAGSIMLDEISRGRQIAGKRKG